jgi:nitroimidazol reductase NimA-like FMN-containing flavoprotein (pyridoxamine 5'-phosphate oxidase superfamily)
MFREMRRKKQLLSEAETIEILKRHTSGVLGVSGDDGYPYTVPLSYTYLDGKLFFHSARSGHKLDGIARNDKVTFCVIDKDEVIQPTFTTHFRSVIVFGRARILTEDSERQAALEGLVEKYSPDFVQEGQGEIKKDWNRVCLVEVKIEHMTGKEAIELIKEKAKEEHL